MYPGMPGQSFRSSSRTIWRYGPDSWVVLSQLWLGLNDKAKTRSLTSFFSSPLKSWQVKNQHRKEHGLGERSLSKTFPEKVWILGYECLQSVGFVRINHKKPWIWDPSQWSFSVSQSVLDFKKTRWEALVGAEFLFKGHSAIPRPAIRFHECVTSPKSSTTWRHLHIHSIQVQNGFPKFH